MWYNFLIWGSKLVRWNPGDNYTLLKITTALKYDVTF
jgi:hypothetical protein